MQAEQNELIQRAASLLQEADSLIVAAGAGMGVDSGLPDFRGNEGFWRAYPALGNARLEFTAMASPHAFSQNPALAWGFYGHRINLYRETIPHHGFALLKHWGEKMPNRYNVFTSNVDGQFQIAGFEPERVNECHGSINHMQCFKPCCSDIWSAEGFNPEIDEEACLITSAFPICPNCRGMARPNVMMFGDWHWVPDRQDIQSSRMQRWLSSVKKPVVVELGAGTAVPTVRKFSEFIARNFGGRLVRINLREPQVESTNDVGLPMGALAGLNAIADRLGPDWLVQESES